MSDRCVSAWHDHGADSGCPWCGQTWIRHSVQPQALARLEAERDNLLAALREIGTPASVPRGFEPLDWWKHTACKRGEIARDALGISAEELMTAQAVDRTLEGEIKAVQWTGGLTSTDMAALAVIARNFVEAHERRDPELLFPTLSEHAAFDSLRANIGSLARNRRV